MSSLRAKWGEIGCRVLVAGAYRRQWIEQFSGCAEGSLEPESVKSTFDVPGYTQAKKHGDKQGATEVVRRCLDKAYRCRVKLELARLEAKGYGEPVIVAPYKEGSPNALAKTAAEFLGKKLKIDVDDSIRELPCAARHDCQNQSAKFFDRPKFEGEVEAGKLYLLIDDMVTTGATLAELRSYIVQNGGHVAFACSLASNDGMDKQLHPHEETLAQVDKVFKSLGEAAREALKTSAGIIPDTLTEGEASFLGSHKGRNAMLRFVENLRS